MISIAANRRPWTPGYGKARLFLLGVVAALGACQSPAPPPSLLLESVRTHPDDPAPIYYLARSLAYRGQPDQALQRLNELQQSSWDLGIPTADFEAISSNSGFLKLQAQLNRRALPVVRSQILTRVADTPIRPEGLAYDPESRTLFLGDLGLGDVYAVCADGRSSRYYRSPTRQSAYGMTVAKGQLWALHNANPLPDRNPASMASALTAITLEGAQTDACNGATTALSRRYPFPSGELNDLCLIDHRVYVSDSRLGVLYELDLEAEQPSPRVVAEGRIGINGVACDSDQQRVYFADWLNIGRYEITSSQATTLDRAPGLTAGGIDGLYYQDGQLIGIQNGLGIGRLVALELDAEGLGINSLRILEQGTPEQEIPTTGAIVDGALLYLSNSQLARPAQRPLDPIVVRRLPVQRWTH